MRTPSIKVTFQIVQGSAQAVCGLFLLCSILPAGTQASRQFRSQSRHLADKIVLLIKPVFWMSGLQ